MSTGRQNLFVRVEQPDLSSEYVFDGRKKVTIGRAPHNDVVMFDSRLPVKSVLFERSRQGYLLLLPETAGGEVISGDTRMSFADMIAHGLLPRRKGRYVYPVSERKKGAITLGDTRISFIYPYTQQKVEKFTGYSWTRASLRDLSRDLPFKLIFCGVLVACLICLNYMRGLPVDVNPDELRTKVPPRLARIIVRNPGDVEPADLPGTEIGPAGDAEQQGSEQVEQGEAGGVESQNVLGLLAGSGDVASSGSLADFLLGEQLVRELDEVMASTDLQVGRTSGNEDAIDALIAGNGGVVNGGIDDLLNDIGEIESVSLSKGGEIQIEGGAGLQATPDAMGKRSEESVRRVLTANSGRLTYIYNKYLKRSPELNGKMVVDVVIAANGSVEQVRKSSSSMNHPEFEREILDFIRRWRYESIAKGTVTVTYPLIFNKIG